MQYRWEGGNSNGMILNYGIFAFSDVENIWTATENSAIDRLTLTQWDNQVLKGTFRATLLHTPINRSQNSLQNRELTDGVIDIRFYQ